MNDTAKSVRAYVFTQLNGNISYGGSNVPVVAKPTDLTSYPYIVVSTNAFVDDGTKDRFGGVHDLSIEIHTRHKLNVGGQDDADDISNLVLQQIRVRQATSDFGDDTMYMFVLRGMRWQYDDDGDYDYYTKVLSFDANVLSDV